MDPSTNISIETFRVVAVVLSSVACIVTVFRLGLRTRSRLWWWDDSFALLSMLSLVILVSALWVHTSDPALLTHTNRIAVYYVSAEFFYAVNWSARLSILFTVVRIAPFPLQKRRLAWVAVAFAFAWAFVSAQTIWICEGSGQDWKDSPLVTCDLGKQSGIAQLVLETLADLLLVSVPVHFFLKAALQKGLRLRLIAVFSTSAMTTIVALVHASFILVFPGLVEATAAVIEDAVALAVCNLSVIVPAFARLCRGDRDPRSEDIPLSGMHGSSTSRPSNSNVGATVVIAPTQASGIPIGLNTGYTDDFEKNPDKLRVMY